MFMVVKPLYLKVAKPIKLMRRHGLYKVFPTEAQPRIQYLLWVYHLLSIHQEQHVAVVFVNEKHVYPPGVWTPSPSRKIWC